MLNPANALIRLKKERPGGVRRALGRVQEVPSQEARRRFAILQPFARRNRRRGAGQSIALRTGLSLPAAARRPGCPASPLRPA